MFKTTLKEIERLAWVQGREQFKEFLKEHDLTPIKVKLMAYSACEEGIGAYLAAFMLSNGLVVWVNTENRSSWNACIWNSDFGL